MSRKWTLLCLGLTGVYLLSFIGVVTVSAQEEDPAPGTACRTCHEERYWLYDTGKWYCKCGEQRTCVDCHGGDGTAWDVKLAHEGLVKNPIEESPSVCQDCHPEDYATRIDAFVAMDGKDPIATPYPAYTPDTAYALVSSDQPGSLILQDQPIEPWRIIALGLVGVSFVVVVLFGYRCWKVDCLAKTIHA